MINLFGKLERESLLKKNGWLLDLGSGKSRLSEKFLEAGYEVTLVDQDEAVLKEADNNFKKVNERGFKIINAKIEDFEFGDKNYDGIIISNVLPFQKDKESVKKIVKNAWNKLNSGGFLYLTLFGVKDQWAAEHRDTMIFYEKEENLRILDVPPYYFSEDYGKGATLKGDIKTWHIFSLLYIK